MTLGETTIRAIVRQELARHRKLEQFAGIVSDVAPLTVRLNSGADVHISHRPVGMQVAVGDFVIVQYTGETFLLHNVATTADDTGTPPAHNHDSSYAAVSHAHTTLGWHYLTTLSGTGSSNTIGPYTFPSGYTSFDFLIRWDHTGGGLEPVYVRLNNDNIQNYDLMRADVRADQHVGNPPSQFNEWDYGSSTQFFHRLGQFLAMGRMTLHDVNLNSVGWTGITRSVGNVAAENTLMFQSSKWTAGPATNIRFLTGTAAGGSAVNWGSSTRIHVLGLKVA